MYPSVKQLPLARTACQAVFVVAQVLMDDYGINTGHIDRHGKTYKHNRYLSGEELAKELNEIVNPVNAVEMPESSPPELILPDGIRLSMMRLIEGSCIRMPSTSRLTPKCAPFFISMLVTNAQAGWLTLSTPSTARTDFSLLSLLSTFFQTMTSIMHWTPTMQSTSSTS